MKIIYPITSLVVVLTAHDEAHPEAYMYSSAGRPNFGPNAVRFSVKSVQNSCPPGTDCFNSGESTSQARSERYRQRRERINKAFAEMQEEMRDVQQRNNGRFGRYREWPATMGRNFNEVDKEAVKKWVDRAFDLASEWNKDFTPSPKERESNEEILDETREWVDNLYKQDTEVASAGTDPQAVSDGSKQPSEVDTSSEPSPTDEMQPEVPYSENRSNNEMFQVAVDLPGVERTDIDIALQGGFLTIEAIRRSSESGQGTRKYMKKFALLEDEVDVNEIEATLENGVLMVTAPKKKKEELKIKIPVV